MPEDSDALYAAYRGLRQAYSERMEGKGAKVEMGSLFSPSPEETEEEGGERWLAKLSYGLGVMLDVISV